MDNFVSAALAQYESVMIQCTIDKTRSIVIVISFLMHRYSWSLVKALDYVYSKKQTAELSQENFESLTSYEGELLRAERLLSTGWKASDSKCAFPEEEQILANTYFNSLQLEEEDSLI